MTKNGRSLMSIVCSLLYSLLLWPPSGLVRAAFVVSNDDYSQAYVTVVSGPAYVTGHFDSNGNVISSTYKHPTGLHFEDANQWILVADAQNNAIRLFSIATGYAATVVIFDRMPISVTCDQKCSTVYAAGVDNVIYATQLIFGQTVRGRPLVGISNSTNFTAGSSYGTQKPCFAKLSTVFRDRPARALWFSDAAAGVIGTVDLLSNDVRLIAGDPKNRTVVDGTADVAKLGEPAALVVCILGRIIYFIDRNPNRTAFPVGGVIRKIILSPDTSKAAASNSSRPQMMVVTLAGNWMEQTVTYAIGNALDARFSWQRGGISTDPSGTLVFVSNDVNNVIQVLNTTSNRVTNAAGPPPPYSGASGYDGYAPVATFDSPTGLTYAAQGFLLVVEEKSSSIRMLRPLPPGNFLFFRTGSLSNSHTAEQTISFSATRTSPTKTRTRPRTVTRSRSFETSVSESSSHSNEATRTITITAPALPTNTPQETLSRLELSSTVSSSSDLSRSTSMSQEFASKTDSTTISPPPSRSHTNTSNATRSHTPSRPPTRTRTRTTMSRSSSIDTSASTSDLITNSAILTPTLPTRSVRPPTPSKPVSRSTSPSIDPTTTLTPPPTRTKTRTVTLALPQRVIHFAPAIVVATGVSSAVAVGTLGGVLFSSFAFVPAATDIQVMILMSQHSCFRGVFGTTFDQITFLARITALLDAPLTPIQSLAISGLLPVGVVLIHVVFAEGVVRLLCFGGIAASATETRRSRKLRRVEQRFKGTLSEEHLPSRAKAHAAARFPAASLFVAIYMLPMVGFDVSKQLWFSRTDSSASLGDLIFGAVVLFGALCAVLLLFLGRLSSGRNWAPFAFIFDSFPARGWVRSYVIPEGSWAQSNHRHRFGPLYFFAPKSHVAFARLIWPLRALLLGCVCATQLDGSLGCHALAGGFLVVFSSLAILSTYSGILRSPLVRWFEVFSNAALCLVSLSGLGDALIDAVGPAFGFIALVTVPAAAIGQTVVVAVEELYWRRLERQSASTHSPTARRLARDQKRRATPPPTVDAGSSVGPSETWIKLESSTSDSSPDEASAQHPVLRLPKLADAGSNIAEVLSSPRPTWLQRPPMPTATELWGQDSLISYNGLLDVSPLRSPEAVGQPGQFWVPAALSGAPVLPQPSGVPLFFNLGGGVNSSGSDSDRSRKSRTRRTKAKR